MNEATGAAMKLGHRLLQWGIVLFLLGLLTGLVIPLMTNPRMGVSSHLEGVMNGPFLIVLGLMWTRLRLGPRALTIAFWLAIYGTYANWATTFYAGLVGAGEQLAPISAAGHPGTPLEQAMVAFGFMSLTVAIIQLCGMVLYGLRGGPQVMRNG
jgi:hydroxylaminobenzene mutase